MHHNKIFSLILLISVLLLVIPFNPLAAAEPVLNADFRHRPPEMVVEGSSISGPLKDILEIAAKNIGYGIEWRIVPFSKSLEGLKTGQVDIVPRTLRKPEREAFVNYLGPISIQRKDILFCVPKGKETSVLGYEDLKNLRVGVKSKTSYFSKFDSDSNLNKVPTDGDKNLARLFVDGKIDTIAVLDRQPLEEAFSKLNYKAYTYANFRHAHAIGNYYGMSKGSSHGDIFDALNQALLKMKVSGQIDDIFNNYGIAKELNANNPFGLTEVEKMWLSEHPGPFRVSNEQKFPPFNFNVNGKPEGFSIGYMDLLARKLNIAVEYVSGPAWLEFLDMMRNHDIDIMLNIIRTQDRLKYIAFTKPYINNPIAIITRSDQVFIKTINDLRGKSVVLPKGFYYQEIIEKKYPNIHLLLVKNQSEALKKVSMGEADATIGSLAVNNYLISRQFLSNLRVSGFISSDIMQGNLSIGVRKDWQILAGIFQKIIDSITQEEFLALQKKWLGDFQTSALKEGMESGTPSFSMTEKKVALTPEEQAFIREHEGPIIAGAETDWPPFDFVEDGKPTGYSNDLLRLAAKKAALPLEFVFGFTWAELMEKFKNGKIDILPAVYKIPERTREMAFTKDYGANPSVLVVHEKSPHMSALKDLTGKTLAVVEGFSITRVLLEKYPEIQQFPVGNVLEGLKAVSLKKADAFVGGLGVISYLLSENVIPYLRIVDEVLLEEPEATQLHMATLKDQAILRDILQKGLNAISPEEKQNLRRRWLPDQFERVNDALDLGLSDLEKKWLSKHSRMSLGVDPSWPPFEFMDSDGKYSGVASGIVELIKKRLNIQMSPLPDLTWSQVVTKMKAGEIDVLPAVVPTAQRKNYMMFSQPYASFPIIIATHQDMTFVNNFEGLKKKKVGVVKDYFMEDRLRTDHPYLNLVTFKTTADGLQELEAGRIDAFMGNLVTVGDEIRRLFLKKIKIAAVTEYKMELCLGVQKDFPVLVGILNKALKSIGNQEKAAIVNAWLTPQEIKIGADYKKILVWAIPIAIGGALLLLFIIIWNRRMSREVTQRQKAEERFQNIAGTAPGAIIQLRFDGEGWPEYLYLSAKAEMFFGMPPEKVIQEKKRLDWHPDDQQRINEEIRTSVAAEEDQNLVGRIQTVGGGVKWIQIDASASRSPDGGLIYNGFIVDITDRKKAEDAIKDSEERMGQIIDFLPDPTWVIDTEGKVVAWNRALENLTGIKAQDMLGKDNHEYAIPFYGERRPVLIDLVSVWDESYENKYLSVKKVGEKLVSESFHPLLGKEGIYLAGTAHRILDASGEAVGAIESVRDITEQKAMEETIRESQQRLSLLVKSSPLGVIEWDLEFKVVQWNPAAEKIFGFSQKESLGRHASFITPEADRKTADGVWEEILEKRSGHHALSTNVRKNNQLITCEWFNTALVSPEGRVIGAASLVMDVTERKRLENELQENIEEMERFTSLTVDREEKMIQLKEEINTLLEQMGREKKYKIVV